MEGLNLLPWREQQREEHKRQFIIMLVGVIVIGLFIIIISHTLIAQKIQRQQTVNNYLKNELKGLEQQIAEIKDVKLQKAEALQRLKLIYELQASRPLVVKTYDELIRIIPSGLYIENMSRTGNSLILAGNALSNSRVSELMKNIQQSKWFTKPELQEIKTNEKASAYKRRFILKLTLSKEAS